MQKFSTDSAWLAPVAALIAAVVVTVFAVVASTATINELMQEGGGVETASALLHFLAVVVALAFWRRAPGILALMAVCAFLMGARELGWHQSFTSHGVFSSKQYFYDTVPMSDKLLAGAIALTLLAAVGLSMAASVPDIRRMIADRAPAVTGLKTLMTVVPLLMVVDALPRLLRNAGLPPSADDRAHMLAIEELGELALPVIVILVVVQVIRAFPPTAGAASNSTAAPVQPEG